jgi:hypothetical protein
MLTKLLIIFDILLIAYCVWLYNTYDAQAAAINHAVLQAMMDTN